MKRLIDVITVLLLAGAFAMAYYTGFCGTTDSGRPMLATNVFALISMIGAFVLFAVGALSAFVTRVQRNMVTVWSVISTSVQFAAVVGMCSIMSMLWMDMFKLDNSAIRTCYIIFVVIILFGYVDALLFADNLARKDAPALEDGEDDDEDSDSDDEEESEESGSKKKESDDKSFLGF